MNIYEFKESWQMKINVQNINTNQSLTCFGSKNKPVEAFEIDTKQGKLFVREMNADNSFPKEEANNLVKMFIDNFIDGSGSPRWKKYNHPANKEKYETLIQKYTGYIKHLLVNDDGNTTILVAKDSKNNIKAGIISMSYKEVRGLEDNKTFYLDALAVDRQYRNNNVATTLINKALETAKGIFSDFILIGENKAVPLYAKLGFTRPDTTNAKINTVVEKIQKSSADVPRYRKLMHKVLNPEETRWWERAFLKI